MIYLTDTNVLLRVVQPTNPSYQMVQDAVDQLKADGHQLHATSQNFAEFWRVSTRPADKNGFGFTPSYTDVLLWHVEQLFPLLPDSPDVYPEWRRLVVDYSVSGVQVHDARLVAVMIFYNITHILTFNTQDFTRYVPEGIIAIDPAAV
jgi:predicted nucleic acid-binding protein